jgi:hypothetical protein
VEQAVVVRPAALAVDEATTLKSPRGYFRSNRRRDFTGDICLPRFASARWGCRLPYRSFASRVEVEHRTWTQSVQGAVATWSVNSMRYP